MVILSSPLVVVDVSNIKDVVRVLKVYANDWESALQFLSGLASESGYEMDVEAVSQIMRNFYGE